MRTAWHEGKQVVYESEPSRWGQGESALTATNSQHVFRSVAVYSTTGRFDCKRYAFAGGGKAINSNASNAFPTQFVRWKDIVRFCKVLKG